MKIEADPEQVLCSLLKAAIELLSTIAEPGLTSAVPGRAAVRVVLPCLDVDLPFAARWHCERSPPDVGEAPQPLCRYVLATLVVPRCCG